jgi:hypothetical protein
MEPDMRAASLSVSLCHELCLLGGSLETARGVSSRTPLRCQAPDASSSAVLSRPAVVLCGCKGDGCAEGCLELHRVSSCWLPPRRRMHEIELGISIACRGIRLVSVLLAL